MLYSVFVAICVSGTSPAQCDRHTAVDWIPAPEQAEGLGMCAKTGFEFAAESHLIKEGTYPTSSRKAPIPRCSAASVARPSPTT